MKAERIRADVTAPLRALGLFVVDVTIATAGRRQVVRIAVDRDLLDLDPQDTTSRVAPLSLDQVAEATRVVNQVLDDDPQLGSAPYVLEVSSPGVDRPLTEYRQLRRNVGRLVRLALTDGSVQSGRIAAVSDTDCRLAADPGLAESADRVVALAELRSGKVVLEFGAPDLFDDQEDAASEEDS